MLLKTQFHAVVVTFIVAIITFHTDAKTDTLDWAINDTSRLAEHVARDAARKPFEVLNLIGIEKGDKVVDLAAGSGYYTALLSRIVGDEGHVFAVDPELIFVEFPSARKTFPTYAEKDKRKNVSYSVQRFDQLSLPEPVDAILMVLYYHDTLWTPEDRQKMNLAIFDTLKPGGRLLIVDHSAQAGAGADIARTLHRMDEAILVPELLAAGFELVRKSDVLRNSNDPLNVSVFDEQWRGKTDRFAYVFERPTEGVAKHCPNRMRQPWGADIH